MEGSMLPSLAGLRISEPRGTDVGVNLLLDLPDALLAKTLADTAPGNVRALCDAVDALSRAGKRGRDMNAWQDIAGLYNMPGLPYQNTAWHWRRFVMGWCEKIKPGIDQYGQSYLKSSLSTALWGGDVPGWRWIVQTAGLANIPLSWVREYCGLVVSLGRNVVFFVDIWDKQLNLPNNLGMNTNLLNRSVRLGNGAAATWIFNKLMSEKAVAQWPVGPTINNGQPWTPAQLVTKRDELKESIISSAYNGVEDEHYLFTVPVVESLGPPTRNHMVMMLNNAIHANSIPMIQFLDARYTYTYTDFMLDTAVAAPEPDAIDPDDGSSAAGSLLDSFRAR